MTKFPVDTPKAQVLRALAKLGFQVVREREYFFWQETARTEHKRL
jgi:hypothetical protein